MLCKSVNYSHLDDICLFGLAKEGNETAFGEIYNRYFALLVHLARTQVDSQALAEDLVQDTFIAIYRKKAEITLKYSLRAYLIKAVKYKIFNNYRLETVKRKAAESLIFSPICENDFASNYYYKETYQKVERLFARLPEKCREVFGLSRQYGLSQKQIAEKLHISTSTVEKHVVKALKIFRRELIA